MSARMRLSANCCRSVLRGAVCTVVMLSAGGVGCVRRRMIVRTQPPGAAVSIDNQPIGISPAATPFNYYGTREILVERDGYRTEKIKQKFRPPWYQLPGVDFIAETLWPGEIRDNRIVDVQLVPEVMAPTEEVIDRADRLRGQSRDGIITNP